MSESIFSASKRYDNSCFILTDRKFSRLIEVGKERMDRTNKNLEQVESYAITFEDGKEIQLGKLEDVLSLDNSNKNPIIQITISTCIFSEHTEIHSINIRFRKSTPSGWGSNISIEARSEDLGWLQETMGALEEQVERTIPKDIAYSLNKSSLGTAIFILFFFILLVLSSLSSSKKQFSITDAQSIELQTLANQAKTDSEKINLIFKYFESTIKNNSQSINLSRYLKEPKTYFIGAPLIIGLMSIICAVFWFYPRNVFAWGDRGEWYEKTIERRKFLWYGVALSLVIGILGNLFVLGATSP